MNLARLLLAVLLLVGIAPVVVAEDGAGSSAAAVDLQDLQKAIPHGISLLEKQDYQAFVKTFVPPEELARETKNSTLAVFAARFGANEAAKMLTVLKATKDMKGITEKDGETVVYRVPGGDAKSGGEPAAEIRFIRMDKRWYIKSFRG